MEDTGLQLEPDRPKTQLIIDVLSDTWTHTTASSVGEDAECPCPLSQKTPTGTHKHIIITVNDTSRGKAGQSDTVLQEYTEVQLLVQLY